MDCPQFLAHLAEQSSLVYFGYSPTEGRVHYVSPAYEHLLGGHPATVNEELPGWLAALHPDDRAYLTHRWPAVLAGGTLQDQLLRLALPNGDTRWLCLTISGFVPAGEGPPLLGGHLADVTRSQTLLETANRYQAKKNSMLEILSHDLASPLVLTEQMAEYLTERVESLADPQLNRMIEGMRQACQEGMRLVHDFVEQEFLDSVNVNLLLVRLDLAERLRQVLDNYQQRQHAAGHLFYYQASHPSIYADIDENKFLQVVNNLLGNALKFTPDGGHIRVVLSQHPTHLLLTVADDGIGIPAALQPSLFERFTPARRPGLRGEKSTGLGMSIIKTVVELHHGRIWVESQEDHGTTFSIWLPLPKGS